MESSGKIDDDHITRHAALYIRQSSLRQVIENQESTKRQYALRQKAISLGWQEEDIDVIDDDLGVSGAADTQRSGFKRLISEVSQGNIGIVISIEASRLSRNSSDWSKLLEVCRLTRTLILDEDGVYDPGDFNDRMLLGLKGTMSEAELHYIHARMKGGLDNKARRGELKINIPIGYVYDDFDQIIKDPDEDVQRVINLVFKTYARFHSCQRTLRELRGQNILYPKKDRVVYNCRTFKWCEITHKQILRLIHNPIYAGVYQFGLRKYIKTLNGYKTVIQDKEDRIAYIENHHEAYISIEQFNLNQQSLAERRVGKRGNDIRRINAVRQGCALLQGIVYCGKCGKQMSVRYDTYPAYGTIISRPSYWCVEEKMQTGADACQRTSGTVIDKAIGDLLVEMVSPLAMSSVIQVQNELIVRDKEIDVIKIKDLGRCRKEMEMARNRYLNVDPENMHVARRLESDWNNKIKIYEERLNQYEREKRDNFDSIDEITNQYIMSIADNFKSIWTNPAVSNEERKRMVRLLIDNVLITQLESNIHLVICFRAGTVNELDIQKGKKSYETWRTPEEALEIIKEALDKFIPPSEIATLLNSKGLKSGKGIPYTRILVHNLIAYHNFRSLSQRYIDLGYIPQIEIIKKTGLTGKKIKRLRDTKRITNYKTAEKNKFFYKLEDFRAYMAK
jgi:DNA invertase Pin-like site-specific DNA recombinase